MQAAYRNVGDILPVYQLSTEDVALNEVVADDVGKWVFLIQGCLMGFYDTQEECQDRVRQLMND
jgi:hypothetical protein